MSPEEMRAKSADKVKQVTDLMKLLHLTVEAKERVSPEGFIEKMVYWTDSEPYPSAVPTDAPASEEAGSTGEETKEEEVAPASEEPEAPAENV